MTTPGRNFGWKMIFFTCVCGIGDDAGAADFRASAGRRRHRNDRRNTLDARTRPPIPNILEIPDRTRLAGHEGDALAEIEARTATEGDDAVMAAVLESLHAGIEVLLVRVRIDVCEDRAAEACIFQDVERILGNRHRGQAAIGNQQRLLHAKALAGVRQLLDAAAAELEGCRIAPVGCDIAAAHAVTFFR